MPAAREHGEPLALLFIDLDHFKRVNDSLGHLVGDTLLKTLAHRITASLRADRPGRALRRRRVHGAAAGHRIAPPTWPRWRPSCCTAIEAPVDADGRSISVTPSLGVAIFPGDGDTSDELIKHADTAMYSAKARGRANVQFFDPADGERRLRRAGDRKRAGAGVGARRVRAAVPAAGARARRRAQSAPRR